MRIKSNLIPDNIRRLMPENQRRQLKAFTADEALQKNAELAEKEIQNQIASWLSLNGIKFIRPRMDRKSTIANGWPDFTFCHNGVPFTVEVKDATGSLSDEQRQLHPQLEANGWKVHTVRSLAEFISVVRGAGA